MNIKSVCFSVRVPIFRYNFAAFPFTTMPNTPGLSNAEAKRAQLLAELAAKKKAREEEDAAALKALEEQIAKEAAAAAAAARMKEHEEAMALARAEKCKVTMRDDGLELVEVRLLFFRF
jgi:hypothetical protein